MHTHKLIAIGAAAWLAAACSGESGFQERARTGGDAAATVRADAESVPTAPSPDSADVDQASRVRIWTKDELDRDTMVKYLAFHLYKSIETGRVQEGDKLEALLDYVAERAVYTGIPKDVAKQVIIAFPDMTQRLSISRTQAATAAKIIYGSLDRNPVVEAQGTGLMLLGSGDELSPNQEEALAKLDELYEAKKAEIAQDKLDLADAQKRAKAEEAARLLAEKRAAAAEAHAAASDKARAAAEERMAKLASELAAKQADIDALSASVGQLKSDLEAARAAQAAAQAAQAAAAAAAASAPSQLPEAQQFPAGFFRTGDPHGPGAGHYFNGFNANCSFESWTHWKVKGGPDNWLGVMWLPGKPSDLFPASRYRNGYHDHGRCSI